MVLAPRAAGDTPPSPTTPTQTAPAPVTVTNPTTDVTPAPDPAPKKTPAPKKAPPTSSTHSTPVHSSAPSSHPVTVVQPAPTFAPAIPASPAHAATSKPRPTTKSHVRAAPGQASSCTVVSARAASGVAGRTAHKPRNLVSISSARRSRRKLVARVAACDGSGGSQHAGPRLCPRSRRPCSAAPRPGVHSRGRSPPPPRPPSGRATPAVDRRGRHLTALGEPHPVHAQHVGSRSMRHGPSSVPSQHALVAAGLSARLVGLTTSVHRRGGDRIRRARSGECVRRCPTVPKVSLPIGLATLSAVGRTMAEDSRPRRSRLTL